MKLSKNKKTVLIVVIIAALLIFVFKNKIKEFIKKPFPNPNGLNGSNGGYVSTSGSNLPKAFYVWGFFWNDHYVQTNGIYEKCDITDGIYTNCTVITESEYKAIYLADGSLYTQ